MTLSINEFNGLPRMEKQNFIHNYEWNLGVEKGGPIGYGVAVMGFLREKGIGLPCYSELFPKLTDKTHYHCIGCGDIYNAPFETGKIIGKTSKILPNILGEVFNLSSGICKPCLPKLINKKN